MTEPILEARDLHYSYPDGTEALRGVSFSVASGEALAVVGANGAGKSTLLLHLNGYLQPSRGELRLKGQPVTPATVGQARRAVGMVFEDPDDQLFMPTVHEDVAFGPLNFGVPYEEIDQRTSQALAQAGAAHLKDRPPYMLSAGEKRAVTIATALALQPEILVLDEPSSHLDPRGRRRLIELLKALPQTRIVATHDLELVVEVCSRVIVIDSGVIAAVGETVELLNDEELMLAHGLERPHILRHLHPH